MKTSLFVISIILVVIATYLIWPSSRPKDIIFIGSPSALGSPLTNSEDRITKKPFGLYSSPANSPVSPEHFTGYHTGTDFEIFENEKDIDVPVFAICDGTLISTQTAQGYGGVVVQSCTLDKEPITIVYGHLKLSSVVVLGTELKKGQTLGILGKGFSAETAGERKHLHLGIHKGPSINILGYVQNKADLAQWLNWEEVN